jgi:hypothetical protein
MIHDVTTEQWSKITAQIKPIQIKDFKAIQIDAGYISITIFEPYK